MTKHQPAADGSLDPETVRDILAFEEFYQLRDKAVRALLGRGLSPTRLRYDLMRLAIVEFGQGRIHGLSFYQRELAVFAGRFAIRDEVHRLATAGVLVLENNPTDRRALVIRPSSALVAWCEKQVPILKSEIRRLFLTPPIPGKNG